MYAKLGQVQLFVENIIRTSCKQIGHIFNDNAMMHFRKSLQRRQKQLTLDKVLAKKAWKATAEEEESTARKGKRREKRQKDNHPVFYGKRLPKNSYVYK